MFLLLLYLSTNFDLQKILVLIQYWDIDTIAKLSDYIENIKRFQQQLFLHPAREVRAFYFEGG